MPERPSRAQRRVHRLLDGRPQAGDPLDVACYWLLLLVIVATTAALIVGSVPSVEARWGRALRAFDVVVGTLFLVEYAARVWSAPADPRFADGWRGRLRFVRTPLALLDLATLVALLLPHLPVELRQARLVRLLALVRVAKVGRVEQAAAMMGRILRGRRDDLLVAVGAIVFVLLVGSTLVHFVERKAQPEKFGTIPDALWWGVATVTTVGYGDAYPVTAAGRLLGGLLAVLGIASFALPTAILGAAWLDELQRARAAGEAADPHACPTCGRAREAPPRDPAADATA
ncbi:ion transporter [Roseisolibacter sp. H3M3-2]|uniref:ion transporter n=1 Tax=Roseisolibacter sp. H3M3-2 TaxID=3031323 RepID=UPI0023DBCCCC|nr:ion transporter [Roseisolibacter sp. H3M3-2]MDF1503444.1 ion transporter [Roseisolibacter sp. H3M3-2]